MVTQILAVMGTRPEKVKIEPVLRALPNYAQITVLETGQHSTLIAQTDVQTREYSIHKLALFEQGLSLPESLGWLVLEISKFIASREFDVVLVQGDTISALAGATAARFSEIPVAHIEAGLRTFNDQSPWPEELARKVISSIATLHFAPTDLSKANLLAEGVPVDHIRVTGNTSVDVVERLLEEDASLREIRNKKINPQPGGQIVVTLHRREAHGASRLKALTNLRSFLDNHQEYSALVVSHPNPAVLADLEKSGIREHPSVQISEPLSHRGMLLAVANSPFVISDSGGLQEEAPSLGRTVFIARDETERPEAVDVGRNFICGANLEDLEENYSKWLEVRAAHGADNPYGDGKSGERIAGLIMEMFG